jgi:hypothetical protein
MKTPLLCAAALLVAGLGAGCQAVRIVPEGRTMQRCADAADMALAQQIRYQEQITFLHAQQEVLGVKERDLFREMLAFRDREADVLRDPGVPNRDRAAHAAMYESLAINRDAQIVRCKELSSTLSGSINSWAGRRDAKVREWYVYSEVRPLLEE